MTTTLSTLTLVPSGDHQLALRSRAQSCVCVPVDCRRPYASVADQLSTDPYHNRFVGSSLMILERPTYDAKAVVTPLDDERRVLQPQSLSSPDADERSIVDSLRFVALSVWAKMHEQPCSA